MTTLHPFSTSRESILPLFSQAAQTRRASSPETRVSELFVLLHGMLFTNIQLDDFVPTLGRFLERVEIEGAEEREWVMMGVVNVAAVLEYGRPSGLLRRVGALGGGSLGAVGVMAKKPAVSMSRHQHHGAPEAAERMDIDDGLDKDRDTAMKSPSLYSAHAYTPTSPTPTPTVQLPLQLKCALQLTFALLSHVLQHPMRQKSSYARPMLNPYLTILLTFLATVLGQHQPSQSHQQHHFGALEVLERSVPWEAMAKFLRDVPRRVLIVQGLMSSEEVGSRPSGVNGVSGFSSNPQSAPSPDRWPMLTSGCAPPLPEDWCMRGMEWVGRRVFERGYWKGEEERKAELEVLETGEGGDEEGTDGRIEDDEDDPDQGAGKRSAALTKSELVRRWIRIARCAVNIADVVDGFTRVEGTREWRVEGKLEEKVKRWKEEEREEREEEEKRRMRRRWVGDAMDVDLEEEEEEETEESEEADGVVDEEIKQLKVLIQPKFIRLILISWSRLGVDTLRAFFSQLGVVQPRLDIRPYLHLLQFLRLIGERLSLTLAYRNTQPPKPIHPADVMNLPSSQDLPSWLQTQIFSYPPSLPSLRL